MFAARFAVPAGALGDPVDAVGPHGSFLRMPHRTLVGVGHPVALPLPGGLRDEAALEACMETLRSVVVVTDSAAASTAHAVVAFGALPFAPGDSAQLRLHPVTAAWDQDGSGWLTVLSDEVEALPRTTEEALRRWVHPPSDDVSPRSPSLDVPTLDDVGPSEAAFVDGVAQILETIEAGDVEKVVLARQLSLTVTTAWDVMGIVRRWSTLEPTSTVFAFDLGAHWFLGGSPELLVARTGTQVVSAPLAGTRANSPDSTEEDIEFLHAGKDGREHRYVVDAIRRVLEAHLLLDEVPEAPEIVELHRIRHLGTRISGTVIDDRRSSALELAAALHPTPAVGGVPRQRALELIARLEPAARGNYAGPVGFVDAAGDGRWMVGIRSAVIEGARATLAAGAGIVAGSDPQAELTETTWKLQSILDALAPESELAGAMEQAVRS